MVSHWCRRRTCAQLCQLRRSRRPQHLISSCNKTPSFPPFMASKTIRALASLVVTPSTCQSTAGLSTILTPMKRTQSLGQVRPIHTLTTAFTLKEDSKRTAEASAQLKSRQCICDRRNKPERTTQLTALLTTLTKRNSLLILTKRLTKSVCATKRWVNAKIWPVLSPSGKISTQQSLTSASKKKTLRKKWDAPGDLPSHRWGTSPQIRCKWTRRWTVSRWDRVPLSRIQTIWERLALARNTSANYSHSKISRRPKLTASSSSRRKSRVGLTWVCLDSNRGKRWMSMKVDSSPVSPWTRKMVLRKDRKAGHNNKYNRMLWWCSSQISRSSPKGTQLLHQNEWVSDTSLKMND